MENVIKSSLSRLGKLGDFLQRTIFNLTENEVRLIEFQNSTLLILWGVWLLLANPARLYGTGEILASLGPNGLFWGIVCLILGFAQAITGFNRTPVHGRIISAFIASLFWGFLTCVTPYAEPGKLVTPTYLVLTVTQAVVYLRLSLGAEEKKNGEAKGKN